jgi:hypothetical protein
MYKKIITFLLIGASLSAAAQRNAADSSPTELGPLHGENETFARDQLFVTWDWVSKMKTTSTSGGSVAEYPQGGKQYKITFDRSGRVTIAENGKTVNATTYSLMEDDARLVFGNWDDPNGFKIDEGPFDFENNILWIRGEYNDKGSTWQLVKTGTQAYTIPVSSVPTTQTTQTSQPAPVYQQSARPAATPARRKTTTSAKRRGR